MNIKFNESLPQLVLSSRGHRHVQNKIPILQKEDIQGFKESLNGGWYLLLNQDKHQLGYGYLAKQNQGIGWYVPEAILKTDLLQLVTALLEQAKVRRSSLFHQELTNAYRLFNGAGDGLGGVTVDYYNQYLVISWYNEVLVRSADIFYQALQTVYPDTQGIYVKYRFNHPDFPNVSEHAFGKKAPEPLLILENGVTYATYLNEGWMTGIFLDQREVRNYLLESLAVGKTVLNTFSYTGAFSVAAAMGGAVETVNVDVAKRSLAKTKEQYEVNQLPFDAKQCVIMNVFEYFRYAKRKGIFFDIIILDPPSFARTKKETFSVVKDYPRLVFEASQLLKEGGCLICSTNAANFPLKQFKEKIALGFKEANRTAILQNTFRLPVDFTVCDHWPESNYLKVLHYQVH